MQIKSPKDERIEEEVRQMYFGYMALTEEERNKITPDEYARKVASQYYRDYMNKYYKPLFRLKGLPDF